VEGERETFADGREGDGHAQLRTCIMGVCTSNPTAVMHFVPLRGHHQDGVVKIR
jgi:hypothetical protein